MPSTASELGRALSRVAHLLRTASIGLVVVVVVLLGFRVADAYRAARDVHPLLGFAFLVVLAVGLWILVGRPVRRFLRVPVALRPPRLPDAAERRPSDLVRHLGFVERYLEGLRRNPEWDGDPKALDEALDLLRRLSERALRAQTSDLPLLGAEVTRFEEETVGRVLQPLDRKASEAIRTEALRVGLATAVSPYGTLDAFVVLWRNANLVARIATIYYGRPGTRGTLLILRDVSLATVAGAYLQDLTEVAGDLVGSLAGKTAGFLAGPLMEGCLNAVATLRIGYVAKGRCRAFSAWTGRTAAQAARAALGEAALFSAGLVRDLVKSVGGGLLGLAGHALGSLVDRVAGLFRRPSAPSTDEAPAGA